MAGPNMEVFESYFRRADLDGDGKISGIEAVNFFQGSGLPKHVLAQVWMHADQNRTGFLGNKEFYNALKLVTVAQSGRELTADMVKAALFGPAAAKIPPPRINPVPVPTAQTSSMATPTSQLGSMSRPPNQMGGMVPHQMGGMASNQMGSTAPNQMGGMTPNQMGGMAPNQMGSVAPNQMGSMAPNQMGITAPNQMRVMAPNQMGVTGQNQMGIMAPSYQNIGVRGPQVTPNTSTNSQVPPSSFNHFSRPPQATTPMPSFSLQGPNQGLQGAANLGQRPPSSNAPSLSTDWLGSRNTGTFVGENSVLAMTPGFSPRQQAPSIPTSPVSSRSLVPVSSSPQPVDSKALVLSGNGFSSDSFTGGDGFSASQAKPNVSTSSFSANIVPHASTASSSTAGSQGKTVQADPFQSFVALPRGGSQPQPAQSQVNQSQPDFKQGSAVLSVPPASTAASQAEPQWPKITQADVKKYRNVFLEVDKDRDGKITGEQARNLFTSWRLPREVLKQVWDLSDQDNDSMLSLREFCIALYLMERYREGHPLPAVLPNSLMLDPTLLQAAGPPTAAYGGVSWQTTPGLQQAGIPGARPVMPMPGSGLSTHIQSPVAQQQPQQNSNGPYGENLLNQTKEEHDGSNSKFQETTDEVNKGQEVEKILDSREKIEFYRTKMQDLVLYKSRCDNRLNEITERASSDKREVEMLAKKYEEKYKQVAEVASKLTVEEATFRDIQERKQELENALVKMEQGGSIDGLLQVRADRMQSDLEELAKALSQRCKHHGIDVKTTATIELPFGWQPGIQEGAVDWDEEWDKFEDEGFSIAKELGGDAEAISEPAKKSPSSWDTEEASPFESSHVHSNSAERLADNGSAYDHSEDGFARSPSESPGRSTFESPSQEFHSPVHDLSPHAKDTYSDHGGTDSIFGDKFVDDSWGAAFDTNDDDESVWDYNAKDAGQNSFYDSGDFGLNPLKVNSPSSSSDFGGEKKKSFFDDSVPSSPLFNSNSPRFSEGGFDSHTFDSSSRFDSFSMRDGGLFQQRENLARFDSMRSTSEFSHSHGYSFDDSDPFGSTGPFKSTETPRKSTDNWNAF